MTIPRLGWRALALFWAAILVLTAATATTLQILGPPLHTQTAAHPAATEPTHTATNEQPHEGTPPPHDQAAAHDQPPPHTPATPPPATRPPPPAPTRVAAPDPALLEPSRIFPTAQLPRVAPDGRKPRTLYAAPTPSIPPNTPRIALLLAGFGLADKDSRAVIDQLPGPVSLAISAYAPPAPALLEAARAAGHELLASIPMEPQGYPLNDEGTRSLRTSLNPDENRQNLEWALTRTQGAVGATGASDGMRGERFAEVSGAFDPVLDEIARRGLLYIDPRPGRPIDHQGLSARSVDIVLDESPARAEIEAKLVSLERIAREKGTALGLVGALHPVTTERIAAWTKTLAAKGLILVPASSLIGQ